MRYPPAGASSCARRSAECPGYWRRLRVVRTRAAWLGGDRMNLSFYKRLARDGVPRAKRLVDAFNPDQPRDPDGKFSEGSGSGSSGQPERIRDWTDRTKEFTSMGVTGGMLSTVAARGNTYAEKESLKKAGFKWEPESRTWQKEVLLPISGNGIDKPYRLELKSHPDPKQDERFLLAKAIGGNRPGIALYHGDIGGKLIWAAKTHSARAEYEGDPAAIARANVASFEEIHNL